MTELRLVDIDTAFEREAATVANEPSVRLLRSIMAASQDCVKIVNLDGRIDYMNHNGQCLMQVEDFAALRGRLWSDMWPDGARATVVGAVEEARAGRASRFEALCPTAKGEVRWWDVSVAPVRDPDGTVSAILSTSRDITKQIEREARLRSHEHQLRSFNNQQAEQLDEKDRRLALLDVLMREIDHRVKNSLAMISGLLRLQARVVEHETARAELHDAANRVITVSRVHERLYQAGNMQCVDLGAYVTPLGEEIVSAVGATGISIESAITAGEITADQAVPVGLIVAELVSNAVRHGLQTREGTVTIRGGLKDGVVTIEVGDDGIGLPEGFDPFASRGLGMRIVQLYATQLGGTIDHAPASPSGTTFTLSF